MNAPELSIIVPVYQTKKIFKSMCGQYFNPGFPEIRTIIS